MLWSVGCGDDLVMMQRCIADAHLSGCCCAGTRPPRVALLVHADKLPACANSETSRSSRVEGVGVGR